MSRGLTLGYENRLRDQGERGERRDQLHGTGAAGASRVLVKTRAMIVRPIGHRGHGGLTFSDEEREDWRSSLEDMMGDAERDDWRRSLDDMVSEGWRVVSNGSAPAR